MLGKAPLSDAKVAVLGVLAGADLRLSELGEISESFRLATAKGCDFHLGTVLDERYAGTIKLVGLFFDSVRPVGETEEDEPDISMISPSSHKGRNRRHSDSRLAIGAMGREHFRGVDGTFMGGEDLDTPTFIRRGLKLDR